MVYIRSGHDRQMLANEHSEQFTERQAATATHEIVSEIFVHVASSVVREQQKRKLGAAISHTPSLTQTHHTSASSDQSRTKEGVGGLV